VEQAGVYSPAATSTTGRLLSDRFIRLLVLATLFFLASFITYERLEICQRLRIAPLAFIPLSGGLHGGAPAYFTRLMHNVMHPLCLLGYTVLAACLAILPLKQSKKTISPFFFTAVAFLFLAGGVGYFISVMLPMGNPVAHITAR
jgi:hypothetical protein